jgi:hypothetical protein
MFLQNIVPNLHALWDGRKFVVDAEKTKKAKNHANVTETSPPTSNSPASAESPFPGTSPSSALAYSPAYFIPEKEGVGGSQRVGSSCPIDNSSASGRRAAENFYTL